jgi:hypothetical protein
MDNLNGPLKEHCMWVSGAALSAGLVRELQTLIARAHAQLRESPQ